MRHAVRYAILEAPSDLGLKPTGVRSLGPRLLQHGLAERISGRRAGRLDVPEYTGERDAKTGTLHPRELAQWSPVLADAVDEILARGEFPVILGGDCSILLGSALALKRRGRYGLLFIDGHADFYQPEVNPNGEVASMDLAFVTGRGPTGLTDLEGRGPFVRDEDAVAFGFRDEDEQRAYGSQPLPPALKALPLTAIRRLGIDAAASAAVEHLTREGLDGFFIHLDADCLDDRIMPAVDYRTPDGLTADELSTTLRVALASGSAVGIEVAVYNPSLDHDGHAGRILTDILAEALGAP